MSYYGEDCEIKWKDRRRYFGMPISFTRYAIVEKPGKWLKLFSHTGLLSTASEELYFYRVDDLSVYQSMFDKLFGVGTITVYGRDASDETMVLHKIKNPYQVRDMISSFVEQERRVKNVRYSEFQS